MTLPYCEHGIPIVACPWVHEDAPTSRDVRRRSGRIAAACISLLALIGGAAYAMSVRR